MERLARRSVRKSLASSTNFGSQYFEHLEREQRVSLHQGEEVGTADKTHARARVGDSGERVRLVADQGRKTEHGAWQGGNGKDARAVLRIHGKSGGALVNKVNAHRGVVLAEEQSIWIANQGGCPCFEGTDEFGIGDKCRGIWLHEMPFFWNERFQSKPRLSNATEIIPFREAGYCDVDHLRLVTQ